EDSAGEIAVAVASSKGRRARTSFSFSWSVRSSCSGVSETQPCSTVLSRLTPHRWSMTLDGTRIEDEFLLLEVLNMPSLGPNLYVPGQCSCRGASCAGAAECCSGSCVSHRCVP